MIASFSLLYYNNIITQNFFGFCKERGGGVVVKLPKSKVSKNELCALPSCCGSNSQTLSHTLSYITHTLLHAHTHPLTHI